MQILLNDIVINFLFRFSNFVLLLNLQRKDIFHIALSYLTYLKISRFVLIRFHIPFLISVFFVLVICFVFDYDIMDLIKSNVTMFNRI